MHGWRPAEYALVMHRGAAIAGGAQINYSGVFCGAHPTLRTLASLAAGSACSTYRALLGDVAADQAADDECHPDGDRAQSELAQA
jgi:hypothetical protein